MFASTTSTPLYNLSLHAALPIPRRLRRGEGKQSARGQAAGRGCRAGLRGGADRKSTRLNSSHVERSYAGFRSTKKQAAEGSCRAGLRGGADRKSTRLNSSHVARS